MSRASGQMSALRQVMSAWYLCFTLFLGLVVLGEVVGLDHLSQIENDSISRLDQDVAAGKEICMNLSLRPMGRESFV